MSEIQLIQESWEKSKPTYKVVAVNESDEFVYARGLKKVTEAVNAVYDVAWDDKFNDCNTKIVEVVGESESVIWSSDPKVQVCESVLVKEVEAGDGEKKGLWGKVKDAAKGAMKKLKTGWNAVATLTKNFSKDTLSKWRDAHYFNKQGEITGLGYKVMTGQAKNTVEVDTGDKRNDITNVWNVVKSDATASLKKQGMREIKDIQAIVKNDKDPITLSASVVTKDGDEQTVQLDQQGNLLAGTGVNADNPAPGSEGYKAKNGGGANGGGGANTQQITPDQAQKNPKAALGNLATRVANLEKEVGIASESWNFNDEQFTNKSGLERLTIRRFFNEMNDPSMKEIVFVSESGEKKTYYTNAGSEAYAAFKKDFRESTDKCAKNKELSQYKVTFESSNARSNRRGFKFSDFGMSDDFDSDTKTLVIRESVVRVMPKGKETSTKKAVVSESSNDDSDARFSSTTKDVKSSDAEPGSNGFELEVGELDPKKEIDGLLKSLNKYNGVEPKKPENQDGSIDAGVSTYPDEGPVDTSDKVVTEADGDEGGDDAGGGDDEGGGDADPFAGDDADGGGDDAGGGDADPFAGGEDAGGDAGGDADPFAGGEDEGGAAGAEGGDAGGDAGAEGDDSGAEGGEDPEAPEPAPDAAVNTDAQGNPKSQYNINVTRPFNVDEEFSLTEEEQKEFFGKIDQLVKIPDMDNYALYLYQITPENMNLDDVHYIQALYELSVKLGLLEDVYADSNLLDKYNSYKFSVMKKGGEGNDEFKVQEQKNPIWGNKMMLESEKDGKYTVGVPTAQEDNEAKAKELKDASSKEKQSAEDRLGPKEQKLDVDKNGAPKPVIIDTTKEGWDSLNGKTNTKDKKLIDGTVEGSFHGLGWVVTFKAMQFGSPRFMSMYIKRRGDEKAEKQCEEYLKKLSYNDIEFVNIEEIDPYEYVYRQSASGMKSPEELATAKFANKDIPYLESGEPSSLPNDIKRDVKRVITKLNAEIRGTKQFNFMEACGVEKPQIDQNEFLAGYKKAQVNETLSETTYKWIFKKNDDLLSRMFYSNMKEKLMKYLGSFAQKFNLECGCEVTPTIIKIDFIRSDLGNPQYDLDTMIDAAIATQPVEEPVEKSNVAPTLDQAMEIAKTM